ncbi:hypothetical protein PLESTB_001142300 [Pleodorina starrii]|uniref:phytol kinase n=1 Tax=Pleodorina starrii TaxID=330485 RepID=A0A9W6BRS5_9CHLO|nr:hypothetical protein PLESTM_000562300 [Pleodorina starrii]GLC56755.1 hypothetical protein PLESTB_001142300 [Pleodorina starrii]GLC66911.1 hypothetical protein PLESTF_000489600 [Pleodorina starrii]
MPRGKPSQSGGKAAHSSGRERGSASAAPAAVRLSTGFPLDDTVTKLRRVGATVDRLFPSSPSSASVDGFEGRDPSWQALSAREVEDLARELDALDERFEDLSIHYHRAEGPAATWELMNAVNAVLALDQGAAAMTLLRLTVVAVRMPWQQAAPGGGGSGSSTGSGGVGSSRVTLLQREAFSCALRVASVLMLSADGPNPPQQHQPQQQQQTQQPPQSAAAAPAPPQLHLHLLTEFAHRLIRAQSLQAAAQQLAAAADQLAALPEGAVGPAEMRQRAGDLLIDTLQLVEGLSALAFGRMEVPGGRRLPRQVHQLPVAPHSYTVELAAALAESNVLEHAARLLMGLARSSPGASARSPQGTGRGRSKSNSSDNSPASRADKIVGLAALPLIHVYASVYSDRAPPGSSLRRQLEDIKRGQCANFTVLVHGLVALVIADEGPAYGMPADLLARLTLWWAKDVAHEPSPQLMYVGRLHPPAVLAYTSAVSYSREASQLSRRAARCLALRWVRLAVTTAKYDAAAAASELQLGAAGSSSSSSAAPASAFASASASTSAAQPRHVALLLDQASTAEVAVWGLSCALDNLPATRQQSEEGRGAAASGSAAYVAEAAEWWRLALEAAQHAMTEADKVKLQQMGGLLVAPLTGAGPSSSPAAPSPEVQAALAGELLPGLEALLRRAGREASQSPSPQREIAQGLIERLLSTDPSQSSAGAQLGLGPLLAHGEPRQAAALLATLTKLLRRVPCESDDVFSRCVVDLATSCLGTLLGLLGDWVEGGCVAAGGDQQQQQQHPLELRPQLSAATAQLGLMVSYAACEWLPLLSGMLGASWRRHVRSDTVGLTCVQFLLLEWLLLLLPGVCMDECAASSGPGGSAVGGGADGGGDSGGGGGASERSNPEGGELPGSDPGSCHTSSSAFGGGTGGLARGWRHFLMEELGTVELLGRMLRRVERPVDAAKADTELLASMVNACCLLTAACPEEVLLQSTASGGGGAAAAAAGGGQPRGGPWSRKALLSLHSELMRRGQVCRPGVADLLKLLEEVEEARCRGSGAAATGGEGSDDAEGCLGGRSRLDIMGHPALGRLRRAALNGGSNDYQLLRALTTPEDARRRVLLLPLPACANPACTRLEGDSEAAVALRACGGCGAVSYCCRECQTAHWRAGHKVACAVRRSG